MIGEDYVNPKARIERNKAMSDQEKCCVKEEGPITQQIMYLEGLIIRGHGVGERLAKELEPVLSPAEIAEGNEKAKEKVVSVPLAQTIQKMAGSLERVIERLEGIGRRLGL